MSAEMAKQAVKALTENFKRQFPQDGMKQIWQELCQQPDKAIELAVDSICLNSSFIPAPAMLLSKVKEEARKIAAEQSRQREREWAEQKGGSTRDEMNRKGSIFSREQSDAHGKHAVKAILLMLNPHVSRQDKLDCFRAMEESYPGAGWGKEGAKLQREWEAKGVTVEEGAIDELSS